MKTLMRNGRDRRSENPSLGHAKKERVSLFGTDQRITSGPVARRPHSKAEYMTAPERFADSQIPLAPRAPSIHDPNRTSPAGLRRTFRLDHHHRHRRSMVGATDRLEKGAGDLIKAFRAEIGLHCRQTGKAPLPGSKDFRRSRAIEGQFSVVPSGFGNCCKPDVPANRG